MWRHLVYEATGYGSLVFWMPLVFFPWHPSVQYIARLNLGPVLLGTQYTLLIIIALIDGDRLSGTPWSLDGLMELLNNSAYTLILWVHFLCFSLCVANWQALDGCKMGLPWWLRVPCLFLTFFLGPAGVVVYTLVRKFWLWYLPYTEAGSITMTMSLDSEKSFDRLLNPPIFGRMRSQTMDEDSPRPSSLPSSSPGTVPFRPFHPLDVPHPVIDLNAHPMDTNSAIQFNVNVGNGNSDSPRNKYLLN
eukprot:gb/GEZN01005339.1/.p1 GENE.gb/GEZN01005339.1/~~gb/GEZN01005339.1/.p1  ORF type:complete len:247 (-),score=20.99 gb/GEZN01005339.1/:968-1708(-)